MSIAAVFHASVFCLLATSSAMLAIAEGAPFPALMTLLVCAVAFYVTDRKGLFHLPVLAANLLGLAALCAAVFEISGSQDMEGRLLGGSHMIVYLTWIVPFQKKDNRQYWWMCALSVLQVAIGSVLTFDLLYGVLITGYLFLSVWTMSVFSLHQAQMQIHRLGQETAGGDLEIDRLARTTVDAPLRSSIPPAVSAVRERGRPATDAGAMTESLPQRWGISGLDAAYSVVQRDRGEAWIGPRFVAGTLACTCVAMTTSVVLFLVVPRVWLGDLPITNDLSGGLGEIVSGFSGQVRLGSFGRIQESTRRAFSVTLTDEASGQDLSVEGYAASWGYAEPIFRGVVMADYRRGRWLPDWRPVSIPPSLLQSRRRRAFETESTFSDPTVEVSNLTLPAVERRVNQFYRMDRRTTEFLVCLQPLAAPPEGAANSFAEMNLRTLALIRARADRLRRSGDYSVVSSFPPDRAPPRAYLPTSLGSLLSDARRMYLQLPDESTGRLDQLEQLAAEVTGYGSAEKSTTPLERAELLERHLQSSGIYSYTLDQTIVDPELDPVEDFLIHRKQGHCEYFATALTLMCRAVDVPARLVTGYKGGRRNEVSGAFEVEERNAHAWVEVFDGEKWLVFDATPVAPGDGEAEFGAGAVNAWETAKRYVQDLWTAYVVTLTFEQQQAEFYSPVQDAADGVWQDVESQSARGGDLLRDAWGFVKEPGKWFSWREGALSFFLLAIAVLLIWLVRQVWFWTRSSGGAYLAGHGAERVRVDFYERFQRLCAAQGLTRAPAQTPREFAEIVVGRWRLLLASQQLSDVPHDLIDAFYGIRYGGAAVEPQVAARLDGQLSRIEQALQELQNGDAV